MLVRRGNMKKIHNRACWNQIQYFCRNTTIHGLNIVGMPNLHPVERYFWLVVVSIAAAGAISLTISNWNRFIANPTVVSIEKDYRNWENHIPAVTGCFHDKIDLEKARQYIHKQWKTESSDPKYEYYLDFVKLVTNSSYENMYMFDKFKNDPDLFNVDMAELAFNVHPTITGNLITVDKSRRFNSEMVLTEFGICFTFFSKLSHLLTTKNTEFSNETQQTEKKILLCHYLNGLCYARFDSDPVPIKYYVHSYMEVPDISTHHYHELVQSSDMEINYRMIETLPSSNIKYLAPSQRRCRFSDEPMRKDIPVYSISLCRMGCRHDLAIKFCGCKPYFYQIFDGIPCNITGLLCISRYSKTITNISFKKDCKCPETCHLISYIPETPKIIVWQSGSGVYFDQRTTFRWGLLHPSTKYRRDILFGLGDLTVSFGGTLNLFLGISFISIIESVFLIGEITFNALEIKLKRSRQQNVKNKKLMPLINTFYN